MSKGCAPRYDYGSKIAGEARDRRVGSFDWRRETIMTNDISNSRAGIANTANTESSGSPALRRAGARKQTVPTRPFRWLVLIGAFLAAAALPLGFSAPAHADAAVYVSNTGTGEGRDNDFDGGVLGVGTLLESAQQFRTGPDPDGYDLGSIEAQFSSRVPSPGTLTVRVRTTNASNRPGNIVYTLINPPVVGTGFQRFKAPTAPVWRRTPTNSCTCIFWSPTTSNPQLGLVGF